LDLKQEVRTSQEKGLKKGRKWFGIVTKMKGIRFLGERLIEGRTEVHTLPKRSLKSKRGPVDLSG
jgi:hypothetical protein